MGKVYSKCRGKQKVRRPDVRSETAEIATAPTIDNIYSTPPSCHEENVYDNLPTLSDINVEITIPRNSKADKPIVAAIDFGTTYSGYAFSFRHDYQRDPLKISTNLWSTGCRMSMKAPTAVLLNPDGQFDSFGYEAESKYSELAENGLEKGWFYFQRFKMSLFNHERLSRDMMLFDVQGKSQPALTVFSMAICYLKDHLSQVLQSVDRGVLVRTTDIHWVLTVPAIWNDASKQFMREAAKMAGIEENSLSLALEPEAASIFCRKLPVDNIGDGVTMATFQPGIRYLVLDVGGGTVDITVHEIQSDGALREVHTANGGNWGGTVVDEEFWKLVTEIIGIDCLAEVRKCFPADLLDLQRQFEVKKRSFPKIQLGPNVTMRMPITFLETYEQINNMTLAEALSCSKYKETIVIKKDKIQLHYDIFNSFFIESIGKIIGHLKSIMEEVPGVSVFLMVGGFSESALLRSSIRNTFPNIRLVIPAEPEMAVLKGAVLYGHEPMAISSRVCKYTYGIAQFRSFREGEDPESKKRIEKGVAYCDDVFDKHVEQGQTVDVGKSYADKEYFPIADYQALTVLDVFASTEKDPIYVTDPSCTYLGSVVVELCQVSGRTNSPVIVQIYFGGTEITVQGRDKNSGKTTYANLDFLG